MNPPFVTNPPFFGSQAIMDVHLAACVTKPPKGAIHRSFLGDPSTGAFCSVWVSECKENTISPEYTADFRALLKDLRLRRKISRIPHEEIWGFFLDYHCLASWRTP